MSIPCILNAYPNLTKSSKFSYINQLYNLIFVTGSGGKQLQYTRKEIFIIVKEHLKNGLSAIIKHLEGKIYEQSRHSVHIRENTKTSFSKLFHKMRAMWQKVNRTEEIFFQKYEELMRPSSLQYLLLLRRHRPIKAIALPWSFRLVVKGQKEGRPKKYVQRLARTSWHMLLK